MKNTALMVSALCGLLAVAGCKKTADNKSNFEKAINTYYSAYPSCLFSSEVQFPVQVGAGDTDKTSRYDALFDQGLLTRTSAEKKELLILSKRVTNYDLSDKGRSAWTADAQQPGYGNFCYGTPKVSSIDSSTPTTDQPGATTTVNYHWSITGAPGWATAAETQNAFPSVRAALSGSQPAVATLTNTSNGWSVTSGPAHHNNAPGGPDSGIVQ